MKKTTKLICLALSFCMVLAVAVIGVLAVQSINLEIGGSINFTAEGINATISQGTMSQGTLSDGTQSNANIMKEFEITTSSTESTLQQNWTNAKWNDLALKFNENGRAKLDFTVTNDSEALDEYIMVEITTTKGADSKNAVFHSSEDYCIPANDDYDFSISFYVENTEVDASLDFTVDVKLTRVIPSSLPQITQGVAYNGVLYDGPQATLTGSQTSYKIEPVIYMVEDDEVCTVNDFCSDSGSEAHSVELPNTITFVTAGFLAHVSSINFPSSIKYFGSDSGTNAATFWDGGMMEHIELPLGLTRIPSNMFGGSGTTTTLKSVTIPVSVTEIGDYAFYGRAGLTTLNSDLSNITTIGNSAFYNCSSLKVDLNLKSIISIGNNAFYGSGITVL